MYHRISPNHDHLTQFFWIWLCIPDQKNIHIRTMTTFCVLIFLSFYSSWLWKIHSGLIYLRLSLFLSPHTKYTYITCPDADNCFFLASTWIIYKLWKHKKSGWNYIWMDTHMRTQYCGRWWNSELLFHRVILMSGSALSPLSVGLSNGKDLAKKFAARVKCPIEPPSNMLQCLRKVPLQYFLQSEVCSMHYARKNLCLCVHVRG